MAGLVRIQTVVHLIKFGGYRQFNVPKPPLLLAANRYMPFYRNNRDDRKSINLTTK